MDYSALGWLTVPFISVLMNLDHYSLHVYIIHSTIIHVEQPFIF
jgi:predicted aminopeptidase